MSTIPPNWLGSILQTSGAEKSAAERRAAEAASEKERTDRASFTENMQNVIENSDRDGQVYSDAEGQGGQGTPFEEPEESAGFAEEDTPPVPGAGLDVQA